MKMMRPHDITFHRFGKLVALHRISKTTISKTTASGRTRLYWVCLCDCGKVTACESSTLVSGKTKSCGCLKTERFSNNQQEAAKKSAAIRAAKKVARELPTTLVTFASQQGQALMLAAETMPHHLKVAALATVIRTVVHKSGVTP